MKTKPTILTFFFVFFLFGGTFAQDGELPGDANCDGAVNVLDIITIANYFAGNEPDPFCFDNADVNGDGLINVIDLILTSEIYVGGDPEFACGDNITFTYRGEEVTYGTLLRGGLCWFDRNLGASQVPTAGNDPLGYGDLFQWGRLDDGHQDRQSGTTSTLSNSDIPGHDDFITVTSSHGIGAHHKTMRSGRERKALTIPALPAGVCLLRLSSMQSARAGAQTTRPEHTHQH